MNANAINAVSVYLGLIAIAVEYPLVWAAIIPLALFLTFPEWFRQSKKGE